MMNLPKLWQRVDLILFPTLPDQTRHLSLSQYVLFVLVGAIVFSFIGLLAPPIAPVGYDWVHYFSIGKRDPFYPPWTVYVQYLTWPGLVGLTFTGLALALYQRRASPLVMIMAFLTLPTLWVWHLGQLEGIALLGLTGLPWLTPLVLFKPQITIFAFFARKKYLLALSVWLIGSFILWGLWPLEVINFYTLVDNMGEEHKVLIHEITLWNWSLWNWIFPFVIILLWLSRGDIDLLMLAGTFITPHLHLYHYFVIVPAMARAGKWIAVLAVIISWLPILNNWFGQQALYLGHLFPLLLWFSLYLKQHPIKNSILTRIENKLNGTQRI